MAGINPDTLRKAADVKSAITTPTAEGVKGTTTEVLKGAAQGAVTGGWVGAAKGAAVSFARTKAGRRIIGIVLTIAVVSTLMLPLGIVLALTLATSTASYGDEFRSGDAVVASGKEQADVTEAMTEGQKLGLRWQIVLAVRTVQNEEDIDLDRLAEILRSGDIRTLGAGAVYVAGKGLTAGTSASQKQMAVAEHDYYVEALVEYGLTDKEAEKAYTIALKWALGEKEDCLTGPSAAATEQDSAEITTSDGKTVTLTNVQTTNAAKIISFASKLDGMSKDAILISLMAALTESGLKNYANSSVPESLNYPHDAVGSDHDSVGFWQMRQHWGTTKELMDIEYQVKAFFGGPDGPNGGSPRGLFDITGWEAMTKGEAAQAVEVSAFPDRYAANETLAEALFERFGTGMSFCNGGLGIAGEAGHPLGDSSIQVTSLYGKRNSQCTGSYCSSSDHKGIDFGAACGTPIYAIADGKVIHDGPEGGWGNSVVIDHGNGLTTRSAHMPHGGDWAREGTEVKKGDQIGTVGMTGNSFGCHLHFETLIDSKYYDPALVLADMGVQLVYREGLK